MLLHAYQHYHTLSTKHGVHKSTKDIGVLDCGREFYRCLEGINRGPLSIGDHRRLGRLLLQKDAIPTLWNFLRAGDYMVKVDLKDAYLTQFIHNINSIWGLWQLISIHLPPIRPYLCPMDLHQSETSDGSTESMDYQDSDLNRGIGVS